MLSPKDFRDRVRGLLERAEHWSSRDTPEGVACRERAEQIAHKHGLGLYLAVMEQPERD